MKEPINTSRVLRNNLLGLLVAAVVLGLLAKPTDYASLFLFGLGYLGQVAVNLVLGFAHLRRGGAAYFLSALLVLLVGFGSCSAIFLLSNALEGMH